MARRFTHYDIVISGPSDMTEERATVQRAVDDVKERNANYRGLHFDVKYWDKDVLVGSGDPQIIINNTLIQNADLIVALFGKKLGTPTERARIHSRALPLRKDRQTAQEGDHPGYSVHRKYGQLRIDTYFLLKGNHLFSPKEFIGISARQPVYTSTPLLHCADKQSTSHRREYAHHRDTQDTDSPQPTR